MSKKCPIYKGDEYVGCPFKYNIKCKDCHWFHKAKNIAKKGFDYFIDEHKSSLNAKCKEIKMKYNVEVVIKQKINLTVDADNEETASEMADKAVGDAYEDAYYDIVTITKLNEE